MKPYNLEERSFCFARDCRLLIHRLPKTLANVEDGKQLIRSSGSIGANYIEANENLGTKDLRFRMKISRKEAKESEYWLNLLKATNPDAAAPIQELFEEAGALRRIFSSIISKL